MKPCFHVIKTITWVKGKIYTFEFCRTRGSDLSVLESFYNNICVHSIQTLSLVMMVSFARAGTGRESISMYPVEFYLNSIY